MRASVSRSSPRTGAGDRACRAACVAFVLATVVAIFLVATYAQPAAKAEFLAPLAAEHTSVCDRLGQGPGRSEHATCMSELMRLNACPNQGF
jgi:hypothetical protein